MNEIYGWHVALVFLAMYIGWRDQKPGFLRKLYVWYHNLTTPPSKNITVEANKGFVYGQSAKERLKNALPFALLFEAITLAVPDSIPLYVELVLFFTSTVTIWIGFMLVPFFAGLIGLGNWSINTADKIQKGELDPRETLADLGEKARDALLGDEKPREVRPPRAFEPPAEKPYEGPSDEELLRRLKGFGKDK